MFKRPKLVAYMLGSKQAPDISGTVSFYQKKNGVKIVCEIDGLPENKGGFFGFHIHEGKSCGGDAFSETGGHFNPLKKPHPMHSGDLPPLLSAGGIARMSVFTDRFRLEDIEGRTVVIHSDSDDFTTQPSGNSGNKIACGIIRKP